MSKTICIDRQDLMVQDAVDALVKQHAADGQPYTREQIELAFWRWLERRIDALVESGAALVHEGPSYEYCLEYVCRFRPLGAGWQLADGKALVSPLGIVYEGEAPMTAAQIEECLGIPAETTHWHNHEGVVPAAHVIRELLARDEREASR